MTNFLESISTPERVIEIAMINDAKASIMTNEIDEMSFQKMEYISSLTAVEILENEKLMKMASDLYKKIDKIKVNEDSEWISFAKIPAPDRLRWVRILVMGSLSLLEDAKKK